MTLEPLQPLDASGDPNRLADRLRQHHAAALDANPTHYQPETLAGFLADDAERPTPDGLVAALTYDRRANLSRRRELDERERRHRANLAVWSSDLARAEDVAATATATTSTETLIETLRIAPLRRSLAGATADLARLADTRDLLRQTDRRFVERLSELAIERAYDNHDRAKRRQPLAACLARELEESGVLTLARAGDFVAPAGRGAT